MFNHILARATADEMTKLQAKLQAAAPADRPAIFEEIQERVRFCKSLGFDVHLVKNDDLPSPS